MKRLLISCALVLPLVALTAGPAMAEVKTREKSQIKIEGMIGRMVNMFGGKAAREGSCRRWPSKATARRRPTTATGQIIDLSRKKSTTSI